MFKPVNTGLHAVSKSSKRYLTMKIRLTLEKKILILIVSFGQYRKIKSNFTFNLATYRLKKIKKN